MERARTSPSTPPNDKPRRGGGRTLGVIGAILLAAALAVGAWLFLRDGGERDAAVVGVSLQDVLDAPEQHVGRTVAVSGEVIEEHVVEEDVPGATIIGTADQPLLVIAADADDLPASLGDGETVLVTGEVGVLRPDAGGDRDPVLEEGPILERFEGRPFVRATDVQPGHADS